MRFFPQEAWRRYAGLLIIFFALATLAVWHTLNYIQIHLPGPAFSNAAFRVWLITLGFMFITGAFGLWAIQFSGEVETLRRIGRLVDSMDYLRDGLLALDKRGRITGSNPAIQSMINKRLGYQRPMDDVFPCLSRADVQLFTDNETPQEIEREYIHGDIARTLRFRSQPSEGLVLILVSDVTTMTSQHLHRRQMAQLQLIGQIARGVAHDFNNLLCVISGHASLLKRLPPDSPELHQSIESIISNAERGTALAGHLSELARQRTAGQPTNMSHEYAKSAVNILHDSISTDWEIEADIKPMPTVPLTGIQIEQVVLNLAMLAADTLPGAGILKIASGTPADFDGDTTDKNYASVILISAIPSGSTDDATAQFNVSEIESGVILSVIQSMLDEAGCLLEHSVDNGKSFQIKVALPLGNLNTETEGPAEMSPELEAYISEWKVLLAIPGSAESGLSAKMDDVGITTIKVDNITSALAHIEEEQELDSVIIDETILSHEVRGLLKAIIKLRPTAGLLVLCDSSESAIAELAASVIFELKKSNPNQILTSMIEAKNLAIRRK